MARHMRPAPDSNATSVMAINITIPQYAGGGKQHAHGRLGGNAGGHLVNGREQPAKRIAVHRSHTLTPSPSKC